VSSQQGGLPAKWRALAEVVAMVLLLPVVLEPVKWLSARGILRKGPVTGTLPCTGRPFRRARADAWRVEE
jgi:hypothetical protein